MNEQTLQQLLEMIKNLAPEVWAALLKQNMLFGIGDILFSIFLLCATVFIFIIFRKSYEDDDEINTTLTFVLGCLTALVSVLNFWFGIMYLVNPTYWSMHLLLSNVK